MWNRKWKAAASSSKRYSKTWDGFCLNTGKRLFVEVLFKSQQNELRFFWKVAPWNLEIALRLRDWYIFMWQSLEILNAFNTQTLKQVFWETIFLHKTVVPIFGWKYYGWRRNISYKTALSKANVKSNEIGCAEWTEFCH